MLGPVWRVGEPLVALELAVEGLLSSVAPDTSETIKQTSHWDHLAVEASVFQVLVLVPSHFKIPLLYVRIGSRSITHPHPLHLLMGWQGVKRMTSDQVLKWQVYRPCIEIQEKAENMCRRVGCSGQPQAKSAHDHRHVLSGPSHSHPTS